MQGPRTREQLTSDLNRLGTMSGVAAEYGMSLGTLNNRARKWGIRSPTRRGRHKPDDDRRGGVDRHTITPEQTGLSVDGDTATITLPVGIPWTIDGLCRNVGLDPDDWIATNARPNVWQGLAPEGVIVDLHQLKVELVRRVPADLVLPARAAGWKPQRRAPAPTTATRTILVLSDTHAPYQDDGLHECALQWIAKHKPAEAWDLGDLLDLPTPSRHRVTAGFDATPQECVDARYRIDAERVAASPRTRWRALLGNHDVRIEHAIVDKIGAHVARITRAGNPDGAPVLDLAFLLRWDELGIELIRPEGEYFSVTVEIAPGLNGRHGTKAGKHGGSVKTIERRTGSMIQGHAHKAVSHIHVRYDDDGVARCLWTLDVPTMARRDVASSYMEDGDVVHGFWTIALHPDGSWHPELARYDDATRTLFWRGERYVAPGR